MTWSLEDEQDVILVVFWHSDVPREVRTADRVSKASPCQKFHNNISPLPFKHERRSENKRLNMYLQALTTKGPSSLYEIWGSKSSLDISHLKKDCKQDM